MTSPAACHSLHAQARRCCGWVLFARSPDGPLVAVRRRALSNDLPHSNIRRHRRWSCAGHARSGSDVRVRQRPAPSRLPYGMRHRAQRDVSERGRERGIRPSVSSARHRQVHLRQICRQFLLACHEARLVPSGSGLPKLGGSYTAQHDVAALLGHALPSRQSHCPGRKTCEPLHLCRASLRRRWLQDCVKPCC